jgi:dihydrofolate reductase
MKKRRKIVVSIAMSTDGFIARPDGDVGWLDRPGPKRDYGMTKFFKTIDTILWGRKTYDKGIEMGMKSGDFGAKTKNYLFSRRPRKRLLPGFEWTSERVNTFAQQLRAQPGKDIWMMGGGGLIASFLDEGEIDEFRLHVIPILIGEGIPLIHPRHRLIPLKLLSSKAFPDGVIELNYRVQGHS